MESVSLRPHDVCVALQIALQPEFTFRSLAQDVGLSVGECHNAAGRLEKARLYLPHRRSINREALSRFLQDGVPYAFPGLLGAETRGVPTAHSGPALRDRFVEDQPIVWPWDEGRARGSALAPLCKSAPALKTSNPQLYDLLTLVDALRIGRARERQTASEMLAAHLKGPAGSLDS